MQGRQSGQQELFSTVDLETLIPKDHWLRKVDKVLSLEFLYELTQSLYCQDNGRPSIDPVLFFRMPLIGYLFGINSDRQLCRDIHLNLAYRWFCTIPLEQAVPHHSSLTRIRDRMGKPVYQSIFEDLLGQSLTKGHVKGRNMVADATLIKANASMDSLVERDECDPDATMVYRKGSQGGLKYKVHYVADSDSRFIVDCHTTTGSKHEGPVLPERIDYLCDELKLPIKAVIADRGYGRGPTYSAFRTRKIRTYIPLHDARLGKGKLTPTEFIYESRSDRYRCPQGHYLYPYEKLDKGLIKRYRVMGGHCRDCPERTHCLPENAKHRARFVYRSPHQHEIDRVRKRQNTQTFIRKMIHRRGSIEGLFAEAKQFHGLGRARYRRLERVSIQALMTAIAQNAKRAVQIYLYFCFKITSLRPMIGTGV